MQPKLASDSNVTVSWSPTAEQQPGTLWRSNCDTLHIVIATLPPGAIFGSVGCCTTLRTDNRIQDEGSWRVKFEGETLMDVEHACSTGDRMQTIARAADCAA